MLIRYVIGVDPSGNFYEGKGTTGIAVYDIKTDKILRVGYVSAKTARSQVEYWGMVIESLDYLLREYGMRRTVLAVEDYLLYANTAKAQINSTFETPQLIGVIKYYFKDACPVLFRNANTAKTRWTDDILVRKKYLLVDKKLGYYIINENGEMTQVIEHSRDAVRHAIYCGKFEIKGGKVCKKS